MHQDLTSPTERVAELERAFSAFTETSLQLETAYRVLERRVEVLNEALAKAHDDRLAELAEKERIADRLQGLLETLPAAVVVLDGTGCVRDHNPGAVVLFGDALDGRPWSDIVRDHFARDGISGGEFRLRDGRVVNVTTRSLDAQAGRIVLLTDVTETRRLQGQLQRHRRLSEMGQMNARLAHQLRTPLATALLYTSQLTDRTASERSQRYAGKILASLQLLDRMVNDMLRFAGGGGSASHEPIPVNDLFADVAAQLEPQLADGIELEFGAPAGLVFSGDREALTGALMNLATNAMQNGTESSRVSVDAVCDDEHIALRVSDDGPGISVDERDKVFQPFYSTRPGGTGLGLAVVASVARDHGGHVTVSDSTTGGACFSIVIPAANDAALTSGGSAAGLAGERS